MLSVHRNQRVISDDEGLVKIRRLDTPAVVTIRSSIVVPSELRSGVKVEVAVLGSRP